MSSILSTNLAAYVAKRLEGLVGGFQNTFSSSDRPASAFSPPLSDATKEKLKTWTVFLLCFLFSLVGVWLSFRVFGEKISKVGYWEAAVAIAVVMLGITYGAKFANADARKNFTPVDLVQYVSQGFLWPSTWPALAEALGVPPLQGPKGATTQLVQFASHILSL